jgi:hypothetical protein
MNIELNLPATDAAIRATPAFLREAFPLLRAAITMPAARVRRSERNELPGPQQRRQPCTRNTTAANEGKQEL